MNAKAILFDVFGTVVDWRGSLIGELTAFGAGRDIAGDWIALVDRWRGNYVPSMDRVRRGTLPWTRLDDLHRATLDQLVGELGISGLTEADRAHLTRAWHRLHPWPDVVAGLERLKRRHIIGTLSNGNVSLLTNLAKSARLPWDVVIGADLLHHYKPDPEVYRGACALLDLSPAEVMLVAAHNGDLRAARAEGLRTGFVPRPGEYGPHQHQDMTAEAAWDVVATDFGDLAEQLGA